MAFCVPYLVERIACLFLNYSIPGDVSLYGNFVKERKHFGTSKKPTDQKKIPLEFDNPNNIFHKATVSSDKLSLAFISPCNYCGILEIDKNMGKKMGFKQ